MSRRSAPARPASPTLTESERDVVFAAGRAAGLDHVGSCSARAWTSTRDTIERRRSDGLNGSMQFTYRNPARSSDPSRILRSAATVIVAARSYAQQVPEGSAGVRARVARYATADHYGRLEAGLEAMAAELRGLGFRAVVVADSNDLVDREAAWRAGIGWYGKNSLVLVPGEGSWFVLGSVVTDAVISDIPRPLADGCGTCSKCLDACPTGAIVAPGAVDARRCLAWLLQAPGVFPQEHRVALGDRLYGCDECQEVCPPNRTVELRSRRTEPWPVEAEPGPFVDAMQLLDLDDAELLERCARWYVPGRDVSVVRRNLLLVLGNAGAPGDPEVVGRLERFRDGPDELLAEHATWALARLDARAT